MIIKLHTSMTFYYFPFTRIEADCPWLCLIPEKWDQLANPEIIEAEMRNPDTGDQWEHGDRRQEIVFIGHAMQRDVIQVRTSMEILFSIEMI